MPFLWAEKVEQSQQQSEIASPSSDCLPYLRGECPHGISGKLNGVCDKKHPKRCNKYMKWGSKHVNGCNHLECDKLHPILCPKSLDLKCVDTNCSYKLHTLKCVRQLPCRPVPTQQAQQGPQGQSGGQGYQGGVVSPAGGRLSSTQPSNSDTTGQFLRKGGSASQSQLGQLNQGNIYPWMNHPPPGYTRSGLPHPVTQNFQGMTVQHLLETYMRSIQQELASQRESVRLVQQQLSQQLPSNPHLGGPQCPWGIRPSY